MRLSGLGLIAGLLMATQAAQAAVAVRVPFPTYPLYGKIVTIEANGSFVVEHNGLFKVSPGGARRELPVPTIYGTIVSVDGAGNILSFSGTSLFVHRSGGLMERQKVPIKAPNVLGTPFAATAQGDVFTVTGGNILWHRSTGEVLEADILHGAAAGVPVHADTLGNLYILDGGAVFRYQVSYRPAQLLMAY